MRKQLELLREKGAELPEETAELLERQLEAEENAADQNKVEIFDKINMSHGSETPFEESVQVLSENNFYLFNCFDLLCSAVQCFIRI